jgi:hypothetical protein
VDEEFWGGAVSYKYRIEDPRLGRFFSVDPLAPKYPHNSPYAFSENRVIDGVELEGLEFTQTTSSNADGSTTTHFSAVVRMENASKALKPEDMPDLMFAITERMEDLFTTYDPITNTHYDITVTFIHLAEGQKLAEGQFGVRFVDTKPVNGSDMVEAGGAVAGNWENQIFEVAVAEMTDFGRLIKYNNSKIAETFAHEMGHVGGLLHPFKGNGGSSNQSHYKVNEIGVIPQDVHDPYKLLVGFLMTSTGKASYDYYMANKDNLSPYILNNFMMQDYGRAQLLALWDTRVKGMIHYSKSHRLGSLDVPKGVDHMNYHITFGQLQQIANTVGKR